MPVLKNPRHERFAQLLAGGKSATDAYEQAGYRRSDSNGPALARTEEISGRVAEITEEKFEMQRAAATVAAERAAVTVESLIAECEEARQGAVRDGQWSAAIAAVREKGVLSGKRVERAEHGKPGDFDELDRMPVEELRALAEGRLDLEQCRNRPGSDELH